MPPAAETPTHRHQDFISDSARWQAITARDDDIIVTTPPKSGTTWVQGILALLLSGDPKVDANVSVNSPWVDMAFRPLEELLSNIETQVKRRHLKSHSPLNCLPYWQDVRYITVYRHPIDVHFSFRSHENNIQVDIEKTSVQGTERDSFHRFLDIDDGHVTLTSVVDHYNSSMNRGDRSNLLQLHYRDMQRDLAAVFAKIAAHIGVQHPPHVMDTLVDAARFEKMRANADRFVPSAGRGFWKSDTGFFNNASSNKWEGVLNAEDLAAYDAKISQLLTPSDRHWLEWGDGPAG
ncbi:sulfotransferase domain-containing protein [uncultured Pelagimonas sp.]|uniref:sulfotransferase domain-containing protein n=1 Tax=uncultured Pelagimonas sp. TaxID=1618102 RepID=UPI0026323973|nr:sulfotransferase domain-containing protein [uncultured Pelagimonas sp.]